MTSAHIVFFMSIFGVVMLVTEAIPGLLAVYREKYQTNVQTTSRELDKFFLNIKPARIMGGGALLGIALGVLTHSWVLTIAVAGAGLVAPRLMLVIWKNIRSARFEAQFMDALILMGNTLKSGLDMAAAVERISTSMKPPISEEFGLVLNAYRLGTPLETALLDLTERIKSRTLETVIYAINIQRETGGNIIKTFDQMTLTIREESKLQKKVQAITSQGRTQIIFMAVFPWAMAALLFVLAPQFMQPALANPWTQFVVLFLIVWEGIGIVVMKKIATVDV